MMIYFDRYKDLNINFKNIKIDILKIVNYNNNL